MEYIKNEISDLKQMLTQDMTQVQLTMISDMTQKFIDFFGNENYFPHNTWNKCGYISYGLMLLYDQLQYHLAYDFEISRVKPIPLDSQ